MSGTIIMYYRKVFSSTVAKLTRFKTLVLLVQLLIYPAFYSVRLMFLNCLKTFVTTEAYIFLSKSNVFHFGMYDRSKFLIYVLLLD